MLPIWVRAPTRYYIPVAVAGSAHCLVYIPTSTQECLSGHCEQKGCVLAFDAKIIEVMIASPSEVEEERGIVREVLAAWNSLHARDQNVVFLPLGWDTHSSPDLGGRPQQLINDRILARGDLLVGIFWTRIGSPTGKAMSGTVEEIHEHHAAGKPVMLYFSDRPIPPDRLDPVQFEEVKKLRAWAYHEGIVGGYDNSQDFRAKLERHLHITLRENPHLQSIVTVDFRAVFEAALHAKPAPQLSTQAWEVLRHAADSQDGMVMIRNFIGGTVIQSGRTQLASSQLDKRELARWLAAIESLESYGLTKDINGAGEVFEVTDAGYQLVEDNPPGG